MKSPIMVPEILGYPFILLRIEALWAELKKEFNKIYGLIPMMNFKYVLHEVEFPIIVKKMGDEDKMNTFKQLVKKAYDINAIINLCLKMI